MTINKLTLWQKKFKFEILQNNTIQENIKEILIKIK